jgi:chromosome segregation ATPase
MSKPQITLETLYDILQDHTRRFDEHDRMFALQDKRFAEQDKRFDSIDSLQRTMASRLVSIENKLIEHSAILRPLQDRVGSLHSLVERLAGGLDRLDQEYVMITAALRRLERRFDQLEADRLRERITVLESRVAALEASKS